MLTLHPFSALIPAAESVAKVASVPYDVVDRNESLQLSKDNPQSFLHVIRSEIDLAADCDPYSSEVYQKARSNFATLVKLASYKAEAEPALYLYRLEMSGRIQTGIMGCTAVDDYENGKIKVHEKTRPQKVQDRVNHMQATRMHAEPVFLAYRSTSQLEKLVDLEVKSPSLFDFTAADGVRHTLWRISNLNGFVAAFAELNEIYVADGHHRIESARQLRNSMRTNNPEHTGKEEYNYFLSVTFPHTELAILPYHRVIRETDLFGDVLINSLSKNFELTKVDGGEVKTRGKVRVYTAGKWYELKLKPAAEGAEYLETLDSRLLELQILAPIFDIQDLRTDKRIDFVGGIRGTQELKRQVDSGSAKVAFSMYAVSIEDIFEVADQDQVMPPKSTWFEPKLRSGIIVHTFEGYDNEE